MNLTNYYYQFPSVLTPKFVDDIVAYGKQHTPEMAVTGGAQRDDANKKAAAKLYLESQTVSV